MSQLDFEDVTPKPEDLIKSIAEQGYRLETAIADLIDNSISAGADRIEVLVETGKRPFTMFIADNGKGMDLETLKAAMRFPSSSIEAVRVKKDLGRFGLGLKTASFSQSRHFTVLTRKSEQEQFQGRTWDVELLRKKGWALKVESQPEIEELLAQYSSASASHLGEFDESFNARTIVIWRGLYKFEDYIAEQDCADVLKSELTEVTKGHLSLVFHRFMEKPGNTLRLRLNNIEVKPFNPFPPKADGLRRLHLKNRTIGADAIKVEGFVLPTKSIDEAGLSGSEWAPKGKTLMDLEGIYIYRADRLIVYGGWLGLTGRSQRMQLARMRVEIGNSADHLLHLNVAKSQVEMPHDLRAGFKQYIAELRTEAEREYHNRTIRSFESESGPRSRPFIIVQATNKGAQMQVNLEFPLIEELLQALPDNQKGRLKAVLRIFNTELNNIRRVHEDVVFTGVDDGPNKAELIDIVTKLLKQGLGPEFIKSNVIEKLGYQLNSLPTEISDLLREG